MGARWKISLLIIVSAVLFAGITYYRYPGIVISLQQRYAQWDAGLDRKEVRAGGFRWVYYSGGDGDTIVFLNGFGLGKDYWGDMLKHYASSYRVIAPDIPGFGESTRRKDARYDIPRQTARFHEFVSELGLGRFHLAGVSMGGAIAAYYAAFHPEMVKSLFLMDTFGVKSRVVSPAMLRSIKENRNVLCYRTCREFDAIMDLVFVKPPEMPLHFKTYLADKGADEYELQSRIFNDLLHGGTDVLEGHLQKIRAPTLVLWGAKDKLLHVSCVDRISRRIPQCRIYIVDNCGHLPHLEKPDIVRKRYSGFLREL